MNEQHISFAVTGLEENYPGGLLIAHEPKDGFYFFVPGNKESWVDRKMADALLAAEVRPKVMMYSESGNQGHYEPCLRIGGGIPGAAPCAPALAPARRQQGKRDLPQHQKQRPELDTSTSTAAKGCPPTSAPCDQHKRPQAARSTQSGENT